MTASIVLQDLEVSEEKQQEILKAVTNVIKTVNISYVSTTTKPKDLNREYKKVLMNMTMSLKKCATAGFKTKASVDVAEIEQIKNSLMNFKGEEAEVTEFARKMVSELTNFQKVLRNNYVTRIADIKRKEMLVADKIKALETERTETVFNRLKNIVWPYDSKTKDYENQIAQYKNQLRAYQNRLSEAKQTRPSANEKDLLIYELKMKEKYSELY